MLHMLAIPLFLLALVHGTGAGADAETGWALALYLTTGLSVLWLMGYRLLRWNRRAETASAIPSEPPIDRFSPHSQWRRL